MQAGHEPAGFIELTLPNGESWWITFLDEGKLDVSGWGQIELRSSAFYDAVCDTVSRHERRSIDILRDNP
jgi:hypothetical protein